MSNKEYEEQKSYNSNCSHSEVLSSNSNNFPIHGNDFNIPINGEDSHLIKTCSCQKLMGKTGSFVDFKEKRSASSFLLSEEMKNEEEKTHYNTGKINILSVFINKSEENKVNIRKSQRTYETEEGSTKKSVSIIKQMNNTEIHLANENLTINKQHCMTCNIF